MPIPIVDGHLDLAMNALVMNRDLRKSAHQIRFDEQGQSGFGRALGTVGFPDLRTGHVAVSVATVIARTSQTATGQFGSEIEFRTQEISAAQARGQLAWYRELERQGVFRILRDGPAVAAHLAAWQAAL